MSETKTRYYHLFADGRTVEEISRSTFNEICEKDWRRSNTRLVVSVRPNEIYIRKGKWALFIRREQLRQILGDRMK
ncbi:hypothetical protein ES703_60538 [subsurface metagenome]